ncbi:MAG: hypothetical protein ABEJ04_03095 [Halobacteriaceae archaeon]
MPGPDQLEEGDAFFRHYEYEDRDVVVGDLNVADEAVSVDVVDGTAIVVDDSGEESHQREIELPDGAAKAFINNGVVTIEVER